MDKLLSHQMDGGRMRVTRDLIRISAALLVLIVIGLSPGPGWAQSRSGNKYLQEAKILYDNLQYKDALGKLKQAIRVKGNTRADIVEIYKYLGFIYIIQGHTIPPRSPAASRGRQRWCVL